MGWGQQRGSGAVARRSAVAGETLKASRIVGRRAFLGDEHILGFTFAVDGDYVWCRRPGYLRESTRPVSSFLGFCYFFGWKAFTAF